MTSLDEFADGQHIGKALEEALIKSRKLQTELTSSRTAQKHLTNEVTELRKMLDRIAQVRVEDTAVPQWQAGPIEKGKNRGTAMLVLSDLHLDEVVDQFEMVGLNKYNRDIAHQRLQKVIDSTVKILRDYVTGITLDGIVVCLAGDIITGEIHDELARTNEVPVQATIAHWVPVLASAFKHLADEFGTVAVYCVPGNHDRTYHKNPAKKRAESSHAWVIYNWLADSLRDDDRVQFVISTAAEQRFNIYETKFLMHHGDGFRSAGGVGGLYPSMLKWLLRTHQVYSIMNDDWEYAVMGHWHQMLWGPDFIVNGSLKGFDEYALSGKFGYELAQQALVVVTPEHGITNRMPIFAQDGVAEGWQKRGKANGRRS